MFPQDHYVSNLEWKNTPTFQMLQSIFYPKVGLKFLISFVNNVTSIDENIKLNRDEKRSGFLLVQWFRDNWDRIRPYFPNNEYDGNEEYLNEQEYTDQNEHYFPNNDLDDNEEGQIGQEYTDQNEQYFHNNEYDNNEESQTEQEYTDHYEQYFHNDEYYDHDEGQFYLEYDFN